MTQIVIWFVPTRSFGIVYELVHKRASTHALTLYCAPLYHVINMTVYLVGLLISL